MLSKALILATLTLLVGTSKAYSQSAPQAENRSPPHPQSVQPQVQSVEQGPNSSKTQEATFTPYSNYRSSVPSTNSNNYLSYPASSYNRDSYGTSRDAASGNPIFGVSSNADFQLSAYFGQIFWGFVAVTLTLVVSIWIIRFFAGTDIFGGIVDKLQGSGATGRSLDLDGLTSVVYSAIETYGKWAADETHKATGTKNH